MEPEAIGNQNRAGLLRAGPLDRSAKRRTGRRWRRHYLAAGARTRTVKRELQKRRRKTTGRVVRASDGGGG